MGCGHQLRVAGIVAEEKGTASAPEARQLPQLGLLDALHTRVSSAIEARAKDEGTLTQRYVLRSEGTRGTKAAQRSARSCRHGSRFESRQRLACSSSRVTFAVFDYVLTQ